TFSDSSIYEVEINLAGESDNTIVTDAATLGGIVLVLPEDGYQLDHDYTILQAGEIVGTFGEVQWDDDAAFLEAAHTYVNNDVFVRIQRNDVSFADVGTNAYEAALGGALESLSLDGTLMSLLIHSTLEESSEALSQMTGEVHASVHTALVENTALRDAATERVRDAFLVAEGKKPRARRAGGSGASSRPSAPDGPAAWISGYGWLASHDATDVSAAFERRNVGVLGGMDISDANWRLGVLAGYERSAMEAGDLASTANAGHVHAGI